ncbi:hypothetical protein M1146_08215 [Patescibacteria group bacterium]|nr:hypothetical protein [Patescibacteria group bacterium]
MHTQRAEENGTDGEGKVKTGKDKDDRAEEKKERDEKKEKQTRRERIENFSDILWGFSEANAGVGMLSFRKQGKRHLWL